MPAWDYDLIIIGGGPAGLTAGLYAGRARVKTMLLEKLINGGQMMTTDLIENYPGFPEGITGFDLSDRIPKQAERFGLEFRSQEVLALQPGEPVHMVFILEDGQLTAGDVRCKPRRQIGTAVRDGSVAAIAVENYLEELKRG